MRELVVQENADEHREAEIMTVQECPEAPLAVAISDHPEMAHEEQRAGDQTRVIPASHVQLAAGEVERQYRERLQYCDDVPVRVAEQNGRRAHADPHVVVAIHHGVYGVVDGDPDHVGEDEEPGHRRHVVELGREGHGDAPAERDAEVHLRHREESA